MDVNKIKIINSPGDKSIVLPIGENWDLMNRGDTISIEEAKIVDGVIGKPTNYELVRYSMKPITSGPFPGSKLIHEFYFITQDTPSFAFNTSYTGQTASNFTTAEVQYLAKNFFKSFFKIDFYDKIDQFRQKIYFTIILPAYSGKKVVDGATTLYTPVFELDHVGTQEGYYIYWYEDESLFNINEMYFRVKFFNGKTGQYSVFVNSLDQDLLPNPTPLKSVKDENLYYKVEFDYVNFEYIIKDLNDNVINVLTWYQLP